MLDNFDESLALVHYRGGEEEFRLGASHATSEDPLDRAVGSDILGQLGWQDRTYLNESLDILIPMLEDLEAAKEISPPRLYSKFIQFKHISNFGEVLLFLEFYVKRYAR